MWPMLLQAAALKLPVVEGRFMSVSKERNAEFVSPIRS